MTPDRGQVTRCGVALGLGRSASERTTPPAVVAGRLLTVMVLALMWPQPAWATPQKQVTICHATSAVVHAYVRIVVDASSIITDHGHGSHTGPVFPSPGWGDIIPPFEYTGPGEGVERYPGTELARRGHRRLGSLLRRPVRRTARTDRAARVVRAARASEPPASSEPPSEPPASVVRAARPSRPPSSEPPSEPRVGAVRAARSSEPRRAAVGRPSRRRRPRAGRPPSGSASGSVAPTSATSSTVPATPSLPARCDHAPGLATGLRAPPAPGVATSRRRDHARTAGHRYHPRTSRGQAGAPDRRRNGCG